MLFSSRRVEQDIQIGFLARRYIGGFSLPKRASGDHSVMLASWHGVDRCVRKDLAGLLLGRHPHNAKAALIWHGGMDNKEGAPGTYSKPQSGPFPQRGHCNPINQKVSARQA